MSCYDAIVYLCNIVVSHQCVDVVQHLLGKFHPSVSSQTLNFHQTYYYILHLQKNNIVNYFLLTEL